MLKQTLKTMTIFTIAILVIGQMAYAQINEFKITASDAVADDWFGISVSISGDYAIVGASRDDDGGTGAGSAYIFVRDGQSWTEQVKLTASDAGGSDWFGNSVSISGDYAIVGAFQNSWSGSAYIFARDGQSWTEQVKLTASDAGGIDNFGNSVSISGDYAIVGAHWDDNGGTNSGSAYIFVRDGQSWTEQVKLTASDAWAGDRFGSSVSISGDYAIVGALLDSDGGIDAGSAYIFVRDGQSWTEQAKLTASDAGAGDRFGNSVSISGDYAIVGAHWDDDSGYRSGSTYIFVRDGQSWTEQVKLTASDAEPSDQFGNSVSISGDYAIVGHHWDNDAGTNSGSVHLFVRDGQSWTEQTKLTASDATADDRFGSSVSISGDYIIVGAPRDDDGGTDAGSAYLYIGFTLSGVLSVSPDSLDFGDVLVSNTAIEQVTVKNTGTADLNVSSIAISGIDSMNFSVDTTLFTLAPGDSLFLEVNFAPDDTDSFSASLDIDSDGGSANVVLSGNDIIDPAPSIVSIIDVPEDQGGWVYFSWFSSGYDTLGEITQYGIWELNPEDEWVSLGNVPAIQEDEYIYLAHTFGDSTDEGIFWSTFMVTAHTTNPEVFYTSVVDSGYSIDNLAPAVPTGFLASVTEENTVKLSWDEPVDEDFNYFKIYRSLTPDFDPTVIEPFAETIDTVFIDSDVEIAETYYYIISAVDFNGNESEYTDAVETIVLSISDKLGIPTEFGLHQNYPNPFNPVTTIQYELPKRSDVQIIIYDLIGREVTTLVSEIQDAGYKSIIWNATIMPNGMYFYQIRAQQHSSSYDGQAGEFLQIKKMILLK